MSLDVSGTFVDAVFVECLGDPGSFDESVAEGTLVFTEDSDCALEGDAA